MIRIIETVDESVLEVEIEGELTRNDYDRLEKAIENKLSESEKVNMLCRIIEFSGITAKAVLSDFKLLAKYYAKIEKIAIISMKDWAEWVAKLGAVLPMEVMYFDADETDMAWKWLLKNS
ncbi:MAG: STAS/SEC14 domain-containing protein [Bacillota bacterium]